MVFHRQASTQVLQGSNDNYMVETQCTSHKRPSYCYVPRMHLSRTKKDNIRKRERIRVGYIATESGTDIASYNYIRLYKSYWKANHLQLCLALYKLCCLQKQYLSTMHRLKLCLDQKCITRISRF